MPLRAHARRYISGSGFLFAVWVRVVLWWAGGIIGPEWGGPSAKRGEEGETESQTHRRSGKGRRAEGGCRPRAHLIPSVLESQKSSNKARSRGGVAPSCQPRNASSACTVKWGNCSFGGGASPMMSASDFEKLFVSAMTRHFPAAAESIEEGRKRVSTPRSMHSDTTK